ncbi:MAG: LPD38 domain-containing protein [Clostridia bacterium]|nr:LPD38 domain-containing protein [Clostridia bacterium]
MEETKPQAPVIPTKQDGSIDFVAYGKEGSLKELGNTYGEKMPHKVAVTAKAFADDVVKAQKAVEKAQEAYDNAAIGREGKAKEALDKAKANYESVKNEADFWAEMDADIKAAQAEREAMLNPQVEVDMSEQPMTVDEFVAQQLANGNITLTSESFKKETGYGEKERKKFPKMFRKAENGGMSIERAGERLMEIAAEEGLAFFDQEDANAGRDALINFLGSVYSWGDITGYVRNNREAMAKKESEAVRDEMESFIWNAFHMTPEEYATQREIEAVENPYENVDLAAIDAIFAEKEFESQTLNQETNESGRIAEGNQGESGILSEEQVGDNGGNQPSEKERNAEGTGNGTQDESETAQEPELTQKEGESVLDFAARVAEEQRRKPLRERAREWSKSLGVDVVFIEKREDVHNRMVSNALNKGEKVAGWFERANGKVYFYMPNLDNEKEIDNTYIHEVVAHKGVLSLLGEERFNVLCDKVWKMMPITEKVKFFSYPGVADIENEQDRQRAAADEYIAHLAEKQNLTPEEKTIWDNIVKAFRELLDKALNGIIGKAKLTDKDIADLIRASYANLKSGAESKDVVYQNEKTGQTLFSIRTYRESGRDKLIDFVGKRVQDNALTEEQGAEIVSEMDNIYETVQKYTGVYQPFGTWSEADVAVDESGKPVFSVIKANGEYGMNLDFSLVCKKRRTLDAVFDEMIRRGVISDYELGQVDIAKINAVIREFGFETACRLCFVDAKRFRVAKVADDFCSMYNELASMSDAKLKKIVKNTKKATVRKKTAQHLLEHPEDKVMLSRDNFMSAKGFEGIKINKDAVMRLYNSAKGTGGPKASYGDVQYLNDIAAKQWTPEQAYPVGGVRLQSFSDYVPRMVFDYVQMVADLAAKNLPVHAYTKEPIFAKQFGLTGIKINLSLVPRVDADGVAPGLDKDGNYAWQDGETFPYEEAIAIQNAEGYRENCGTIAVGVSDEHIEKMLGDENIRMVIPYHKSGLNPAVAKFNNIDKFADYTNEQNTRNSEGKKLNKTQLADMPNFNQQMHDGMTAREAAQAYLDWCDANGYLPKFDKFRNHPNYYKLLEDFTTIVPVEGVENVYPQQGVQMRFPSESDAFGSMDNLIREGLEEDAILEGRRQEKIGDVVDAIEDALGEGTRFRIEFSQEEQSIIDKAKTNGTYMKAPNGKPTNLTEKQWAQVRTKAFKKWFGDWEKPFRIEKLRNSEYAKIEGDEISSGELTKKDALEYGKKIQKEYKNADTGNMIQLQRGRRNGGINEVLQHNYKDQEHLKSVAAIPQIIEKSIYIQSEENKDKAKNPDVIEYQQYVCGLKIGSEDYTVLSLIAVDSKGNRYYDHNLTRIEKTKLLDLIKDQAVNVEDFGTTPDTESTILSGYKAKKLVSVLQVNSSKIVDENGEPLVVRHRTPNEFNEFSKEKIGSTTDYGAFGLGFYFSPSDFGAWNYGYNMIEAFLNLKNPLVLNNSNAFDVKEPFYGKDYKWGKSESEKFTEWIKENGYDGVHYDYDGKHDEMVAFEPNQIKSATDNVGTFDEGNNDIRFRISNQNQEIFVSNAQKAVEGIKQEKATPQQWLAMIEKNGGLKAGEDKWLGLSDWLKGLDKVTKDNYYISTKANFTKIDDADGRKDLFGIMKYLNEKGFEEHASPYRGSISRYWFDKETGDVYRMSDHWGEVASCTWTVDKESAPISGKSITIAKANLKNFKRKPITKAEILDFIGENKIVIEEVKYGEGDNVGFDEFGGSSYLDDIEREFDNLRVEYGVTEAERKLIENHPGVEEFASAENGYLEWDYDEAEITDWINKDARSKSETNPINSTRLQYTTQGLENKAEIALTVPTIESWNEDDEVHFGDAGEGRAIAWIRFGETTAPKADLEKAAREADDALTAYQNELAEKYLGDEGSGDPTEYLDMMSEDEGKHMRELSGKMFDTRETANANQDRVLVIDEIQSKRHQEGRESGYRDNNALESLSKQREKLSEEKLNIVLEVLHKQGYNHWSEDNPAFKFDVDMIDKAEDGMLGSKEQMDTIKDLNIQLRHIKNEISRQRKGIPSAPFEKNWHELAFKRMLRYAAENGFDKVAWTTGMQQAERYNLGNVVDSISITKSKREEGKYHVTSWDKDTMPIGVASGNKSAEELKELFGKAVADELVNGVENLEEGSDTFVLEGAALEVGGEGMKGFYDKMLPSFVNKYVKKWGTKVQDIELPNLEEAGRIMHSVDVTEAMKESVMEGQTMFRVKDVQPAIDSFTSKYNSKPVVVIDSNMTDGELERLVGFEAKEVRDAIELGLNSGYNPNTDKIYIMTDNVKDSSDLEDSLFHENLHQYLLSDKSLVVEFFTDAEDAYKKNVEQIKKEGYKAYEVPEELFVRVVADSQVKGNFAKIFSFLSEEGKEKLTNLLKENGYDIARETEIRTSGRMDGSGRDGSGRRNGDDIRRVAKESSSVASPSKVEKDGRAREIRQLFDQVADNGLRGVLGDKAYDNAMFEMYRSLPMEARERVAMDALDNHGADMGKAMDKFIGESYDTSLWDVVVGAIRNMLRKKGYNIHFSENDVRYLVWRNRQKLNRESILDVAEDIDTRYRLKVGEYEGSPTDGGDTPDGGGTRFRTKKPEKIDIADERSEIIKSYDKVLKSKSFNFQEAFQDRMLSLKVLMEEIEKATGKKAKSFEDAYKAENQLGSINRPMQIKWLDTFYKPLLEEMKKLSDKYGRENVERYIYCKSGLERNEVLRQRDADEAYNEAKEELDEKLAKNEIDQAQYQVLLAEADKQRTKTLTTDTDYSGIRGLMFNTKADELFNQYKNGNISEAEYKKKVADLKKNEEQEIKDWKKFAEDQVQLIESKASKSELDALWGRINAATNETLRIDFESGMIDRETYEAEKNMMKYYVPLRNWENTTAEDMYEYRHDMTPAVTSNQQKAKGRKSQADNPIATIAIMAQNAIVRGNRNKMKMKLYSFVVNRPTDLASVRNVWYVRDANQQWVPQYADTSAATSEDEIKQIMEQFEIDMQKLEAQGDAYRGKLPFGMKYRANRSQKNDHVVPVMINGKEYAVYINGNPRAAQAVNGLTNAEGIDDAGKWIDAMKRWYGAGLTSWNPDFIIPNLVRDTIHASTMTFLDKGVVESAKYMWNVPKMFAQVAKEVAGLEGDPKLHQYFEEFVANGGETGYTAITTLDDYKKEYNKLINEAKGVKASVLKGGKEAISKIATILEAVNRIAEDTNRFNAYVTSRESGENIVNSIDAAKNITVNFNRKGALAANNTYFGKIASWMSRWILFFNPSVQGMYQIMTKSKANPKRATALGATILSTGFLAPMLNEMLVALFGDDEDDYWNQSDFKRRNNWMLFTGNGYVTIPLPPIFRELYGIGDIMYGVITGHITPQRAVYDVLKQVQSAVGVVNLLPEISQEPDMITYVKGFAPDLAAPILDVVSNTNFMGRPIAKWETWNESSAEYERVYKGVSPQWTELSKLINEAGGNETRRSDWWGNFINPAMMEHLFTSYGGGIGKTINNLAGMAIDAATGNTENMDVFRKSPIVPRFYTPTDEKSVYPGINRKYYEFEYQFNNASKSLKKAKDGVNSGEHPEWQKYIDEMEKNGEAEFIKYFKKESKKLKKLQDKLKENPNDQEAEKKVYDKKAEIATESLKILKGDNK